MTYALEATGLTAVLGGQKVLDVPSLQVNSNEVLMVIGPNGSGKSTLLLCLALLLKPAAGTIAYNGVPVSGSSQVLHLHRRLAMVFQEPLLLNSTVWDNVTLGLRLRGVRGDVANARAQKWLARFGIAHLRKRQARTLSGGEAKRVSLARAFVLQPEVLFLDEPFNALDSPTRQSLLEDFESVLRETRVTTIMVTHDRTEALALADRVAVLIGGRIQQLGTPEEVFSSPVNEAVASFVEAGNILHGTVTVQSGGLATVRVKEQDLEVVSDLGVGTGVIVVLKYEDITLLPSNGGRPSSARNTIRGKIVRALAIGPQVRVTIDCGFTLVTLITRRSWEGLGLGVGQEAIASFKASSVHLIPRLDV
ncbi:MAG: ABC transporter ATP-binding protein [Chloroflexi bacterium]|nr:ABC transporter ATP-binding protein [Chloroflexota bacterium]